MIHNNTIKYIIIYISQHTGMWLPAPNDLIFPWKGQCHEIFYPWPLSIEFNTVNSLTITNKDVASCAAPDDLTGWTRAHRACTERAGRRCACAGGGSARRCAQSASRSPSSRTGRASHLCGSACEPLVNGGLR